MSTQVNPYEANVRVIANPQTAEYGKFVQMTDNTRFPAVSVTRTYYPDDTAAFPANSAAPPLTSVDIYPKFGVINYIANEAVPVTFADSASTDAFGRLRTSQPVTLFDAKHLYDKLPYQFDEVVFGTGSSVFAVGDSCVNLTTSAAGDYVIRQSRVCFNYQPGKSLEALFTGIFAPQANVIKRVGLFQSLFSAPYTPVDGVYLEVTATGPAFVITKTQGASATTVVPQSAWNVDKLDGTGPSGAVVDFTKAQIFVLDMEWLGVGRLRFGFMQGGKTYYAHYENHVNALTNVYLTSPNQPVRYEIRQTGTGTGSLKQICSTVILEGTEEYVGVPASITDGGINADSTTTARPLLYVRSNPGRPDRVNLLRSIEALNISNYPVVIEVFYNPIINGTQPNWVDVPNTGLQYASGSSTAFISGGFNLFKKFVGAGNGNFTTSDSLPIPGIVARLGGQINGTPDIIALGARAITSGANGVYGTMNLIERA